MLERKVTIQRYRRDERLQCTQARDVMTEWGWSRSYEAFTIGLAMMTPEALSMPFLMPSEEVGLGQLARMRYAKTVTGGNSKSSPTTGWAPLVPHAQRGLYEAMASQFFGMNVAITDLAYDGTKAGAFTLSALPAEERTEYFPASAAWSVLDDALGDSRYQENMERGVGGDFMSFVKSDAVLHRIFVERRLARRAGVCLSSPPLFFLQISSRRE